MTDDSQVEIGQNLTRVLTEINLKLDKIKKNSVVGTSSLRREFQLKHLRPDLNFKLIRGNIDTRIKKLDEGLYANIETNKGDIILQLELEKTPITVANFVSLAEGNNPQVSQKFLGKKYYDGLIFHMIHEILDLILLRLLDCLANAIPH